MLPCGVIINRIRGLAAALALLSAGGCSLAPFDEDSGFRKVTTTVGVTGQLAEPKDFVRESRKETEYLPVGVTPPARDVEARKGQGIKDFEKEMMERGRQQQQRAFVPPPKSPYDGKIEPGFRPPPPPPLPAGTTPEVELRGTSGTAAGPDAPETKSTARKPNEKKNPAQSR